ncbi:kynurenine/alpha-aminoadipate aminotransferase, mitochondrial-like isoform X2 [Antedon mediterranea]
MNYLRFLNSISRARKPSPLRVLAELINKSPPTMITMANGYPNSDLFPFEEANIKMKDGSTINIDSKAMGQALQYSSTSGLPDLNQWLLKLQDHLHQPPTRASNGENQIQLTVTNGSQHALCTACEMLLSAGDNVLVGSPLYSGASAMLKPLGVNLIPVETDGDGLRVDSLKKALSKWSPDNINSSLDAPKVLYLVPNGDNPTGGGLPLDRKRQIYEIAQQYNFIILEDDPYYFLQFNKPKVPSFLSLDVDGRVLRFDSFSKVLSAGLRIGFVTGPQALLQRINYHLMASVLHTSGMSQMFVYKLLETWGMERFLKHTQTVSDFYESRRDTFLRAAEKHLTGLAEWSTPRGGMFIWFRLLGVDDTYDLITKKAVEKEVLFVPGISFCTDDSKPSPYVRACYSVATDEQMDEGLKRLANLIIEAQKSS